MTDKLFRRVRDKLQARLDARQREYERLPAVQGLSNDAGNADVSGMPGWVYVRVGNNESVARAFNNKTSHRNGLTVWVGKLPEQPTLFQVLDERQPYFNESAGGGSTKPHAEQHVWPNEDVVYARYRQLADCRVYAQDPASLSVGVADGYYFIEDEIYYYAGATVDLSGEVPGAGRVWVLLEMTATGLNISSHTTSSFDLDTIPKATNKTYWRLAAVALRPAQTEITDYPNDQHIFDLRQSRIAGSEYSDHGYLPGLGDDDHLQYLLDWNDVLLVHKSPGATRTGRYFNTIGDAITAADTGDTILVLEGTYTEDVTVNKTLTIVGLNRRESKISGKLICSAACEILEIGVDLEANTASETIAVAIQTAGVYLDRMWIYVDNEGSGDTYGIKATNTGSGASIVTSCEIYGGSGGDGYGVGMTGTGNLYCRWCHVTSSDYDFSRFAGRLYVDDCVYSSVDGQIERDAFDNVWLIAETALDLDFTGTLYDTKAECNVVGLRFSDSDTPFPGQLRQTVSGTWSHTATEGWIANLSGAAANEGAGIMFPLLRQGNWECEITFKVPAMGTGERIIVAIGIYQEGGHVGWFGESEADQSVGRYYRAFLRTNDGDDTYTNRHTGASVAASGTYTLRIRQKNGCPGVWDDQDNAWHNYTGTFDAAGQAYPATNLFVQMWRGSATPADFYLRSLKLTYLL